MGVTGCQHFILEILTATSAELCFRKLGHSIYHGGFPTLAVHRLCRWCFLFFSSAGTLHPCETSRSLSLTFIRRSPVQNGCFQCADLPLGCRGGHCPLCDFHSMIGCQCECVQAGHVTTLRLQGQGKRK